MPTSAVTGTLQVASDTAAFEQKAYFALRQEFYFDKVADVQPTAQTHPGTSVVFNKTTELAVEATPTPLTELSDITPVAMGDGTVSVTLEEYGKGTTVSAKLRGTSYLNEMLRVSKEVGYNAGKTFDNLARNPLLAGTGVKFPASFGGTGTSRATIVHADVFRADGVRQARTDLTNASVHRFGDGYYRAFIAPDVFYDLSSEVGADAWREPRVQAGSRVEDIWRGTAGVFEGFNFIETPRLDIAELPTGFLNGGVTNEDVYPSIFLGQEAEAKVYAEAVANPEPNIEIAPVTDLLNRFRGVGWFWLGGFGRFREEAIVRYETSSSLGA
jgi:N4-gp56 family major capsid protein